MYLLYSILTAAGTLLLSPFVLISEMRRRKYLHNIRDRLGLRFPGELGPANRAKQEGARSSSRGTIWIHAVSVGEVLSTLPLAQTLKQTYPERRLVISTTTATGQAVARERMTFADAVFYFPLDWRGPVQRALRVVAPELVIILETEIWPNFLREARRAGVPVMIVNGRISDRSFRRYSRALRLTAGLSGVFWRRVLADVRLYVMQTAEDAKRVIALGAAAEHVAIGGNMKYDLATPGMSALVTWLQREVERSHRSPVLIAGSVIAGEEKAVLEAFRAVQQEWPDALLILAPRKPERFGEATAIAEQAGWRAVRRSMLTLDAACDGLLAAPVRGERQSIFLLDTIGELGALYRMADAVFIGGSLEQGGGHNPLEPAVFGKAPAFGPSMENFRDIAAEMIWAGAAVEVRSAAELGSAWATMLSDDVRRDRMGRAALELVTRHRGATAATVAYVAKLLVQRKAGGASQLPQSQAIARQRQR